MLKDKAEASIWCDWKEYQLPLLSCVNCKKFPCRSTTKERMLILQESIFTETHFKGWKEVRSKMYIFKKPGGVLEFAPKGFNVENPDLSLLDNVDEVYVISKTLVKQVKLVVKSKSERDALRAEDTDKPKRSKR